MKVNSRSTLGLFIVSLQIVGFLVITVYILVVIDKLSDLSSKDAEFRNDDVAQWYYVLLYILLVACLIFIFTSVLLIIGIIMRRSIMMKPWIYVNIVGIGVTNLRIIVGVFSGISDGNSFGSILGQFLLGVFIVGLQILIVKNIYNLCKKIEEESEPLT